ncbi:TIGR04222 domain-containing membrane protein [Kibdelosporangium aridum]|uniref:TIGR04222 domain-containing membrane protein n=1 Tax=Kibdelosporangium aridum TaxID=2030 RepID=A0A428YZY3_KIBAR|nr:TIGR04222 domain-containing membrane protein [Kibdelosporangium aridum]RSM77002.1 TIGR04222 domain-containing membrane protein [Kibdelosporangium aridum]
MTEFWLHLGVVVIAAVATVVLRARLRSVDVPLAGLNPTIEDVAFLQAGWQRMVEASIAALAERKAIRIGREGVLSIAGHRNAKPRTGLERVILARAEAGTTIKRLKVTLQHHDAVKQVEMSLVERGLLLRLTPIDLLKAASPLIVAATLDVFLFDPLLLVVTVVLLIAALVPQRWMPYEVKRTTAGTYVLKTTEGTDAATLVALGGIENYPNPVVAKALRSKVIDKDSPWSSALGCGSGGD